MPTLTIRNVPDDIHLGLKALAASHGQSTAAEVRAILAAAIKPTARLKMGQALWELGREAGLTDEDCATLSAFNNHDRPLSASSSIIGLVGDATKP